MCFLYVQDGAEPFLRETVKYEEDCKVVTIVL